MTAGQLRLPREIAEALMAHARLEAPNEACGLLSGEMASGRVAAFHPARNEDASPLRFSVHPDDLVRITFEIEGAGQDLVAIFHSHTHSPAVPSPTDRRSAMYPDALYLIASLTDAAAGPEDALRAWRIRDGNAREAPLRIS